MTEPTNAEAFHVSEYIRDEMEARGWTQGEMAVRMGGDPALNYLELDLCFLQDVRCRLGEEMAKQLATAFGDSAELWLSLDESWHNHPAIRAKKKLTP